MINISSSIKEFDYFNGDKKVGKSSVGRLIMGSDFIDQAFPFRQIIGFYDTRGNYIKLDLLGNIESSVSKSLYWNNFSDKVLEILSRELGFNVKPATRQIEGDKLIGYVKNDGVDLDVKLALKTNNGIQYAAVFFIDLPDLYRGAGKFEGKLYVHGIWEFKSFEGAQQLLKK